MDSNRFKRKLPRSFNLLLIAILLISLLFFVITRNKLDPSEKEVPRETDGYVEQISHGRIPEDFDDCVEIGWPVKTRNDWRRPTGTICLFGVLRSESVDLYTECKNLGGGIGVAEGGPDTPVEYACFIIFPEKGPPCLDNSCGRVTL